MIDYLKITNEEIIEYDDLINKNVKRYSSNIMNLVGALIENKNIYLIYRGQYYRIPIDHVHVQNSLIKSRETNISKTSRKNTIGQGPGLQEPFKKGQ